MGTLGLLLRYVTGQIRRDGSLPPEWAVEGSNSELDLLILLFDSEIRPSFGLPVPPFYIPSLGGVFGSLIWIHTYIFTCPMSLQSTADDHDSFAASGRAWELDPFIKSFLLQQIFLFQISDPLRSVSRYQYTRCPPVGKLISIFLFFAGLLAPSSFSQAHEKLNISACLTRIWGTSTMSF